MKEKILIINDDAAVVDLLRLFLEENNYEVLTALNGWDGINQAIKLQPHLILLDIIMPVLNGYAVCSKLKQNEQTKNIPVIFLSSLTDVKDKIMGLSLGGVDFINRITDKGELLARVQTHLRLSALTNELLERNRLLIQKQDALDKDIEAATSIQKILLPNPKLDLTPLKIAWKCVPCELVGGDVFNVIRPDENHFIFYMLDVSGHGVPSAMITVSVSQQLNHYANYYGIQNTPNPFSPEKVLTALDKEYPIEKFDRFFSLFYMVIDIKKGNFTYSSAGHPPAIFLRANQKYDLLETGGAVIGVNEELPFNEKIKSFQSGDKIILYTDGVTEYQNSKEELYGADRLYSLVDSIKDQPINKIVDAIWNSLQAFGQASPPQDDVSLLGIEFP